MLSLCQRIMAIVRGKLPTEEHKQAWKRFERMMVVKANIAMITQILGTIMQVYFYSFEQQAQDYIKGGLHGNKELIDELVHPISKILMVMECCRVIFVLIAYKAPQISHFYFAFECLFMALRSLLPSPLEAVAFQKTTMYEIIFL